MRARTLWLSLGFLLVTSPLFAQNKWRPKPKPAASAEAKPEAKPESEKTDAAKPETVSPADAAPATTTAPVDDLGEPPPPAVEQKEGTKPSPLTPAPGEFPKGAALPPPPDYDKLLASIAALRSRIAAVTTTLYSSKLRVVFSAEGDDAQIASLKVTLDGGVVYVAPDRFSAEEPRVVYEHAVAPGHHVIGIEIERHDVRGRQFRTFQSSKFTVIVPESKRLEADVLLEDDSDMGEEFPDDEDGEYELVASLRARVVE
jgi:hypothetical protein